MRANICQLKEKYLELAEKLEDGEEIGETQEYFINSVRNLLRRNKYYDKTSIKMFFETLEILLVAEDL